VEGRPRLLVRDEARRRRRRLTKTFSSEVGGANLEDLDEDARVARQSMLETDPPRHTRLRGLVGLPFTPRAVKAYELALVS
jgi:cytochrome P450